MLHSQAGSSISAVSVGSCAIWVLSWESFSGLAIDHDRLRTENCSCLILFLHYTIALFPIFPRGLSSELALQPPNSRPALYHRAFVGSIFCERIFPATLGCKVVLTDGTTGKAQVHSAFSKTLHECQGQHL